MWSVNGKEVTQEEYEAHSISMKHLNESLRTFDWYYTFSDDGRVFRAGTEAEKALKDTVKSLGRDGERLYKAYVDIRFGPHTGFTYSYGADE